MSDNSDSHQLLAVVSTIHHEGVGQAFDDGALCFAESLCGVSAGGVWHVDGGADLDVITTVLLSVCFLFMYIESRTSMRCL